MEKDSLILRSDTSRGFTLIELLVVIAIISILASLLLPAIRAAKDSAEGVYCLSGLKQLATAAIQYESDHNDYLPVPHGVGGRDREWTTALDPYVGNDTGVDEWDPGTATGQPHPYACPVQARFSPSIQTYAENHFLMDWVKEGPVTRTFMLRSGMSGPGRWPATAATIPYFMDGFYLFGHSYPMLARRHLGMNRGLSTEEAIRRAHPHNFGCNIVFLDGHAERMALGEGVFQSTANSFRPRYSDGGWAF